MHDLRDPRNSAGFERKTALRYILSVTHAEGSHNGSAAVLKTAGRKAMQVRVLSPPPFLFKDLHSLIDQFPSVPVATWRDLGALLGRKGKGCLFRKSTAVRRFGGIA